MSVVLAGALAAGVLWAGPAYAALDVYGCDPTHAAVTDLQSRVRWSLDNLYRNVGSLAAAGYFPYYDVPVAGVTGYSHWLNPWYFDKGIYLDPLRPQSVLVDPFQRPIGVMFIEDIEPDSPGSKRPLYVDGSTDPASECMPWHGHADDAARSFFWYYRILWQGNFEYPDQTPSMMHVWYNNERGVFAHEPPASSRTPHLPPLPWRCTDVMTRNGWCPSDNAGGA